MVAVESSGVERRLQQTDHEKTICARLCHKVGVCEEARSVRTQFTNGYPHNAPMLADAKEVHAVDTIRSLGDGDIYGCQEPHHVIAEIITLYNNHLPETVVHAIMDRRIFGSLHPRVESACKHQLDVGIIDPLQIQPHFLKTECQNKE